MIWVGHHGNEHVEQDDDVAAGVDTKHQQRPEPGELFDSWEIHINNIICKVSITRVTCEIKVCEVDESKECPEKRLNGFKQVWKSPPDKTRCMFGLLLRHVTLFPLWDQQVQVFCSSYQTVWNILKIVKIIWTLPSSA